MARLTNAETQARWRERHIEKRRRADRVANLLVRVKWPKGAVEELAEELNTFLTREGNRALRRRLKELADPTEKDKKEQTANTSELVRKQGALLATVGNIPIWRVGGGSGSERPPGCPARASRNAAHALNCVGGPRCCRLRQALPRAFPRLLLGKAAHWKCPCHRHFQHGPAP
jgi:hypothetical protein